MNKTLLLLLFLTPGCSSKENKSAKQSVPKTPPSEIATQILSLENILFDFRAKKDPEQKDFITVKATLSNNNPDTVYLYIWTDHGKQYSLQYDTAKFQYFPESIAHATFPVVEIFPPGKQVSFDAAFKKKQPAGTIKLDFDFIRIEKPKDFNIRNMDFNKVIRFQQQRERTIIYGKEKAIK